MNRSSVKVLSALEQAGPNRSTDVRPKIGSAQSDIGHALTLRHGPRADGTGSVPALREPNTQHGRTTVTGQEHASEPLRFPVQREPAAPTVTLYAIQEWEGYVTEIRKKVFEARLLDLTAGESLPRETARIPLTEISERDAARMRPGSVFRWVIGYRRDTTGTKQRVSVIVFRDLPVMTKAKLRDAEKWADKMLRAFAK